MIHSWMKGEVKGRWSGGETAHKSGPGGPMECLHGAAGTHCTPSILP